MPLTQKQFVQSLLIIKIVCLHAGPLVRIKQALTRLKQEVQQMDVRIGVVRGSRYDTKAVKNCHVAWPSLINESIYIAHISPTVSWCFAQFFSFTELSLIVKIK